MSACWKGGQGWEITCSLFVWDMVDIHCIAAEDAAPAHSWRQGKMWRKGNLGAAIMREKHAWRSFVDKQMLLEMHVHTWLHHTPQHPAPRAQAVWAIIYYNCMQRVKCLIQLICFYLHQYTILFQSDWIDIWIWVTDNYTSHSLLVRKKNTVRGLICETRGTW